VGAVEELERLMQSTHPGLVLAARLALDRLAEDDSQRVSSAAKAVLGREVASVARTEKPMSAPIDPVSPVSTGPRSAVGPRIETPPTAGTPRAAWLPALVLASGWIAAWPVSFGLAMSEWATDLVAGVSSALVGWVVAATLAPIFAISESDPTRPARR